MKWRTLAILSTAELLGMALWFSATAVIPALANEWHLTDAGKSWLTMSVQIGFVVGAFLSALFNLSDIINARKLFAVNAFLGAAFNGAIGLFAQSLEPALILRFLTGVCLAGVYPPGMKIMASWFKEGRGMAIGVLVGALTVGSASPHLLKILGSPDWRQLMLLASASSILAGMLCLLFVKDGPYRSQAAKFDWRYIGRVLRDPGVRLANLGYLGHMWELYAMWAWISIFLLESFNACGLESPTTWSAVGAFAVIGVGGLGCWVAGVLADRYGRTTITIVSMLVSGTCCLLVGYLFGQSPLLLVLLCLVWGFAIVADSAQFSASITELAELNRLIQKATGLKPMMFWGMLGYGKFHYKYVTGREGDWCSVALASQKNYISLYACMSYDGKYIAETYKSKLPKASIGRSCIRFKRLSDLNLKTIEALLKENHKAYKAYKSK